MKIHFKGIYKDKEHKLDYLDEYYTQEHKPNATKLPCTKRKYSKALFLTIALLLLFPLIFLSRYTILTSVSELKYFYFIVAFATLLQIPLLPLHELLHAICFKNDVFMFIYPKKLMMFIIGFDEKSKKAEILMYLLPNIVLGILPFIVSLVFPDCRVLAVFAISWIATGSLDYIDTIRILRYVPNGARIYSHKDGSFWYKPDESELN